MIDRVHTANIVHCNNPAPFLKPFVDASRIQQVIEYITPVTCLDYLLNVEKVCFVAAILSFFDI